MKGAREVLGKVAIVGANGFVGSRMVEQFVLNQIAHLVPVVRKPSSLARLARFDLDWRIADARNPAKLAETLVGCDSVVHTVVGDPREIEGMAAALIPAAERAGTRRIVYLSTASVHGLAPAAGTNESSPLQTNQKFEYNNAKVRAEQRLFREAKTAGVEFIALRPSIVFGPRDRWVSSLVEELDRDTAWLLNDGAGICNSVYVDNLVQAILAALTAPRQSTGQAYLITDDEAVTWRRFYERASVLALGREPIIHFPAIPHFPPPGVMNRLLALRGSSFVQKVLAQAPDRLKRIVKASIRAYPEPKHYSVWDGESKSRPLHLDQERVCLQQCNWQFSCGAAKQNLGYRPQVSFDDGMGRTIDWLRWAGKLGVKTH